MDGRTECDGDADPIYIVATTMLTVTRQADHLPQGTRYAMDIAFFSHDLTQLLRVGNAVLGLEFVEDL